MPKLFAVMLGGRAEKCNTELHDIVFVIAESLEAAYPQLINKWFGLSHRLHIDSSMEVNFVPNHRVVINREKPKHDAKKLYFVNFGGYKPGLFTEIHECNFYVAHSKTEALEQAKQELCLNIEMQHCDDNYAVADLLQEEFTVDDIIQLQAIDEYYIHLQVTDKTEPLDIQSYYRKLDIPHIIEQAQALKASS